MKKRLGSILQEAGVASRRKCETIIFEGRVQVNGEKVLLPQFMVDESDTVELDCEKIAKGEKKVYYILNKPAGYLCTAERKHARSKIVLDLFAHLPYRLFTVGRLDRDTTGLLLVTNDGAFANRVIHPSFGVTKEYLAKTSADILPDHLAAIARGTFIDGEKVTPLKVQKVRKGTVKVILGEGKKREVRILLERAGLEILTLTRIRLGPLLLGNIPEGTFRELTLAEREQFSSRRGGE